MNTILILAQALAKASNLDIQRLDIQYNTTTEKYGALLWLSDEERTISFSIYEDGTITKE